MVNFQVQMLYLIRRFSSKRDVEIRWMSSQNFATIKCLTVSPSMRHGSPGSSRAGSKSKLRKEHRSEIPKKRCGMGLEEAIHVIKDMNLRVSRYMHDSISTTTRRLVYLQAFCFGHK